MKINEAVAAMGVNVERFIAHWVQKETILWPKENPTKSSSGWTTAPKQGWKGCLKNTSSFDQTQLWEEDLKSDSEIFESCNKGVAQLFPFRAGFVFSFSFFDAVLLEIFCIQEVRPEVQVDSSSL